MLSVRIRGQNYRISNEALDRVFGESWRRVDVAQVQRQVRARHDEGKLVVQGRRLRLATQAEEAEQRLRLAESAEEFLRWGLAYVAAQIAEAAAEIRSLRKVVRFDESAATSKLSRDRSKRNADLEARLRDYGAEPSEEFVEQLAARIEAAREHEKQHA
jgi:hypothetical protein